MPSSLRADRGLRALLTFTCIVISVAGLKAIGTIVVPTLVASFFAMLAQPMVRWLSRHKVPNWIAVVFVYIAGIVPFVAISLLLSSSISDFQERIPVYQSELEIWAAPILTWADKQPWISVQELQSSLDAGAVLTTFGSWLGAIGALVSNAVLVLIMVAFMMAEASGLSNRFRMAIGDPDADLGRFSRMTEDVIRYLVIKTQTSVLTGILAYLVVWVAGVDFPMLWGMVAFLLNYIPTIGSIVAAIPPLLLALLQNGWQVAVLVAAAYLVINTVVGNVLEPRWMGRRLGLSTVVVFLSLVFWGWVWGSVGMLLSVPLTMAVKILFEYSDDLRWLGVLMGPNPRVDEIDALRSERLLQSRELSPIILPSNEEFEGGSGFETPSQS